MTRLPTYLLLMQGELLRAEQATPANTQSDRACPLCTPPHMKHLCYKTTSPQRPVPQTPHSVVHHT